MEVTEASTFLFVFWCGEINRLSGPRLVSGSMSGWPRYSPLFPPDDTSHWPGFASPSERGPRVLPRLWTVMGMDVRQASWEVCVGCCAYRGLGLLGEEKKNKIHKCLGSLESALWGFTFTALTNHGCGTHQFELYHSLGAHTTECYCMFWRLKSEIKVSVGSEGHEGESAPHRPQLLVVCW